MATVTGKTSAKIDELLDSTVASAVLDPSGQLVVTKRSGEIVNSGSVGSGIVSAMISAAGRLILTNRQGGTIDAGSVGSKPVDSWPVGSIFMATVSTNPSTLLGGGTWVRYAEGRVIVGVDATDSMFDAGSETGGSKTATVPAHSHTMAHTHEHPHIHDLSTSNNGALGGTASRVNASGTGPVSEATTGGSSAGSTGSGGSSSVSTVQPYITAYLWQRTA